jgi:hypothetical protein
MEIPRGAACELRPANVALSDVLLCLGVVLLVAPPVICVMSMLAYLVKTGELHFRGNLSRPPGLGRKREKSALEQPFKSARTSSRSLLFWRRAIALTAFAAALTAWMPAAQATIGVWPDAFRARQMAVSGGAQCVRVGGQGSAVLLLHGFGDTGDMWAPLAEPLVKDHTVVVPDLRGMGLSSHPEGGYEKTAQARDMAAILDELGIQDIALVTHDIGNMVGYAFAALYPQRDEMGFDGRFPPWHWSLGRPAQKPKALALQLPRS